MRAMYKKFKPHLLMVLVQLGYTFQYFFAEASFHRGLNPFIYVTYRNFVGGVFMLPFAYFLEKVGMGAMYKKFKPHLLMVLVQLGYTFQYFFAEASFHRGLNPFIYVTYRNFVGGVFMLPFAYFLEKKVRPKLTIALFLEIFVLSFLGTSLAANMYFASLRYTSPTFMVSMVNTIPSLTFIVAVLIRLEILNIRSTRSMAKIVGTLVSLAGATTMALYKGSAVKKIGGALIHITRSTAIHEDWIRGPILAVVSCIACSLWYNMQAVTLKRYPAQLSLTTWMSFVSGVQSAVFTAFIAHKPKAWSIGFNIDLWSTLYAGVVVSGLVFIQLWCTEEKGPVFVTTFNPLATIFVALLAYFVFGEKLYQGSIIGGVLVIIGLYLLLWGKEADVKSQKLTTLSCKEAKERDQEKSNNLGGEQVI